ncbi:MAG: UvrD-helicase domain-containing protein [Thermoanaerobaculia bacterium]
MSAATTEPSIADDAAARQRIETSLDESLLVEAAAGTGKTTVLVRRLVAVLERGITEVDRVVAVTFTRKAAGELKLRLRQELDRARGRATEAGAQRHLEQAVARLEEAHVGTIHSFCAEILRARPVEANVDPAFRELDEDESARLYDRAFRGWIERKLDEMPEGLRRALTRLAAPTGGGPSPLDRLRDAGRQLVDWRDFPARWQRRPFDRSADVDRLIEQVEALADAHHRCPDRRDYLRRAIEPAAELALWVRRTESVTDRDYDELEAQLVEALRQLRRNAHWTGRGQRFAPGLLRDEVAAERDALIEELDQFRRHADADLAALLQHELREVLADYEELKRRTGRLDFLDLLVRARDLVRDNRDVRAYLQQRFTHLFVDEFQDSDPLQIEILLLLAAPSPDEEDWRRVRPLPGKLFLVGDPKQSIYRFRRADVLLYQEIKEQLTAAGAGVELIHLTRSFRAVRPLQQAINAAFAPRMREDREVGQPEYIRLDPHREAAGEHPRLVALPVPEPYGWSRVTKTQIEACLPDAAAAFIAWLVEDSGWTIEDPDHRGRQIPIAPRHVVLLFRRFLSWNRDMSQPYVQALEARRIPHVLVGGRSFHQREEVETLRAALTAVEWPDDELSVFATLRGDLFAVTDNLLLRFRAESGSLHPFRPLGDDLAADFQPIREALEILAGLHRRRNQLPVVETVNRLLELTRAHAGLALRPSGHQILANVQHICDLARSFEIRGGLSFRGFIERLNAEAERVGPASAPVVEEGADGVRIMTVHAAKGLEFPVAVLADITANLSRREPGMFLDPPRGLCALKILGCSPWELLENADLERQRDLAESLRVAYVAATRARELLVVPAIGTVPLEDSWVSPLDDVIYPPRASYQRPREPRGCPRFGRTTVLQGPKSYHGPPDDVVRPGLHRPAAGDHEVVWWDPAVLDLRVEGDFGLRRERILSPDSDGTAAAEGLAAYQAWQEKRRRAVERGSVPRFAITTPSEAEQPPPDFEAETRVEKVPRAPGRPEGPRFGTLVHTVMRDVAFDADASTALSLAALHGRMLDAPPEEIEAAVAAVTTALAHPLLRAASAAERCHREAPFVLDLDSGGLVEGTMDLAFFDDGAWTVVDFKTDSDLEAVSERYRVQLAWYVYAMTAITGEPARGVLLGI